MNNDFFEPTPPPPKTANQSRCDFEVVAQPNVSANQMIAY
jgi:hypothetical protein